MLIFKASVYCGQTVITKLGGHADFQELNVTSEADFKAAIDKSVSFGNGRRLDM